MELSFFSCFFPEVCTLKKNQQQSCHKPTAGSVSGIKTKSAELFIDKANPAARFNKKHNNVTVPAVLMDENVNMLHDDFV